MIKLIFPCDYIGITQKYKSSHKALDMGWSKSYGGPNHDILSPYDGVVTYVKNNYNKRDKNGSSYGNYIKINHGSGVITLLAHLKYNSVLVKVGDKVKVGQKLALMGDTGHSTGVHLHYEVRINNDRVDPLKYTYVKEGQKISTNTKLKYTLLKLIKEDSMIEEKKEEAIDTNVIEDNTVFEYLVTKTGTYKIELNENEKLLIKD